jgi:hypothetical protein
VATDAINDVAFAGDLIAISSRNELVVGKRRGHSVDGLDLYDHEFIGGAHGVVAWHSTAFLAPIADQGLLMLEVEETRIKVQIGTPPVSPFNFYRIVRLGYGSEGEVFASAGRRDGLMALEFAHGASPGSMVHHHFRGHDIVDVCFLNDPLSPLAAACVSRDCAIFLIRNVIEDQEPLPLNYQLRGTAYTLLSAQGHLFLLTDQELVVLPSVASRFLRGESLECPLEILSSPVNAAEAFLLYDHSVLLIEEDSTVAELRVADLVGGSAKKQAGSGSGWNGPASQERLMVVNSEVRPPVPIDSGWQWNNQFELNLIPAA